MRPGQVLRDTPVNDTPVNDTPVNDTPVNDTPVNDTPVNDTPVNDTPVNGSQKLALMRSHLGHIDAAVRCHQLGVLVYQPCLTKNIRCRVLQLPTAQYTSVV